VIRLTANGVERAEVCDREVELCSPPFENREGWGIRMVLERKDGPAPSHNLMR
jgi:hypothetical protein